MLLVIVAFVIMNPELSPQTERVQPCFIEPMQVAPVRELPDGGEWTYEAKLDGYRAHSTKPARKNSRHSARVGEMETRASRTREVCRSPVDIILRCRYPYP
jgi:ATP-dependent DNA ligase